MSNCMITRKNNNQQNCVAIGTYSSTNYIYTESIRCDKGVKLTFCRFNKADNRLGSHIVLQGSNDNKTYTDVYKSESVGYVSDFSTETDSSYKYYRIGCKVDGTNKDSYCMGYIEAQK